METIGSLAFAGCESLLTVHSNQVLENIGRTPILLYTDGLNEAENLQHEELGNERVLSILAEEPYSDAQTLIQRLRIAVASHVGSAEPSDDLTLLCLSLRG